MGEQFWRDHSDRLTFDSFSVAATDYPATCRAIADELGLIPDGEIVVGPDQMFWDFRRGNQMVGLDWDIWMGLMVVAKAEASEPLVRDIAAWLNSRPPEANKHA